MGNVLLAQPRQSSANVDPRRSGTVIIHRQCYSSHIFTYGKGGLNSQREESIARCAKLSQAKDGILKLYDEVGDDPIILLTDELYCPSRLGQMVPTWNDIVLSETKYFDSLPNQSYPNFRLLLSQVAHKQSTLSTR